ncbi:FadR family transcriptional regulator [Nocardia panacis]|uniref:FadR family transcriptional regulator n=1 Tax=Nocardia panacis TaxID=2340916 RepID=A0A3A4KHL2_9NOCA|nr:FCD domain-containing protein [Nocardia panacis]RJO73768.1 FadR family transcriptional regulator [Nocardia panacis]
MRKDRSPSRVERVAEAILEEIAAGRRPVGSRIPPEPQLQEMLGVARNTMREAVRALAHAGVLEIRHGDGVYVTARTDMEGMVLRRLAGTDPHDVLVARRALEVAAARAAATRRDAADLERIESAWKLRGEAMTDAEAGIDAGVAFHAAVVAASHNAALIELYRGLDGVVAAGMREQLRADRLPAWDHAAHYALLTAIRAGDPERAARAAAATLDAVIDALDQ